MRLPEPRDVVRREIVALFLAEQQTEDQVPHVVVRFHEPNVLPEGRRTVRRDLVRRTGRPRHIAVERPRVRPDEVLPNDFPTGKPVPPADERISLKRLAERAPGAPPQPRPVQAVGQLAFVPAEPRVRLPKPVRERGEFRPVLPVRLDVGVIRDRRQALQLRPKGVQLVRLLSARGDFLPHARHVASLLRALLFFER